MKRPPALKTTDRPVNEKLILGFDTEDRNGVVKQLCFTDGERFYRFRSRDRALDFLYSLSSLYGRSPLYVCATNLDYDLQNLIGHRWSELYLKLKNGGSQIASARLIGTRIIFYDSLNHCPMGVKRMGDFLGLPKLQMNLGSWRYVERDTLITQRFMVEFQRRYNALGCQFNATLPSSALDLYRREFLPFAVKQPDPRALDFLWSGYYGGRTEVFNVAPQDGTIHYIDVNSLYPFVMRSELYPNPNLYHWAKRPNLDGFGVADVTVRVPRSLYFPPLPYRSDKLLFPAGTFRGVYSYPELRATVQRGGRILGCHRALEFPNGCRPFADYVDTLYPVKRDATDDITRLTAKLLMNSLYGKFAERIELLKMLPLDKIPDDIACPVYGSVGIVNGGTMTPNHTNVIWSLYVTAYARLYLLKQLETIRERGGVVLYCDTDSVIYLGNAVHTAGDGLGDWSVEGQFRHAHFLAPKVYRLDDRFRAKGVPRNKAREFYFEGYAEFDRPYRWKTAQSKGILSSRWVRQHKTLLTRYDKRKIIFGGNTAPRIIRPESRKKGV